MINAQIVRATPEHIAEIIPQVRQADIQEFIAVTGHKPAQVLNTGLAVSTVAWAGIINGKVVAVFGVAPSSMLCGHGIPWLVGTDALEKYQRTFLRRCRPVVNLMLSIYPTLENYIDERNHVAKAWLHWLGFKIEDPVPYGVQELPFHRFHLEKK